MIEAHVKRLRCLSGAGIVTALLAVALETQAAAPSGRFTVASGTVHDNKTGLTWQAAMPSGLYAWGSASTSGTAQSYCATLSLNGSGWRLPTLKELTTIVDYSVASPGPMIDANYFPNTVAALTWSSTPWTAMSGYAWGVYFSSGSSDAQNVSSTYNVRCVR
jgi:hypothetical protein